MNANADDTLKELLFASLKEQRSRRRWGIFFKTLFFLFLFLFLWLIWPQNNNLPLKNSKTSHTALIDVKGVIDTDSRANADDIVTALDDAFKDPATKGVILRIDSPGGSPVQAEIIYNEILRERALYPAIKVYAVCSDVCASAAYYIASAANDIYASPASLVGSIGILIDDFGFTGTMEKLGVERRLLVSGSHKGFLDPFSPLTTDDRKIAQIMLDEIHQQFIQAVLKGRGNRLKVNDNTFSGLAWTGQQALSQGIIDGYGSVQYVARDIIHADTLVDYTIKPNVLDQLAQRFGASFAVHLGAMLGADDNHQKGFRAEF